MKIKYLEPIISVNWQKSIFIKNLEKNVMIISKEFVTSHQ